MCNKRIGCLEHPDNLIDQQHHNLVVSEMDSPATTSTSAPGSASSSIPCSNEDISRVKFLCSFSGSIMPRPLDGKLRYVGGETRIVCVPRDITYEELMVKMRELYEDAAVLKYQQPDEDIDALVSVVNDDDVINMMEEYDKLGSGEGFTRLRVFLFSLSEQDASAHYVDGDERDGEKRYVDALNNLNDGYEFRKLQPGDSPRMSPLDDINITEQFMSPVGFESSLHGQRSCDMSMQFNLHHLALPGQHQHPINQRYSDADSPWSPGYFSPRHPGHLDPRPLTEFPPSPSSRYCMPFGEVPDKNLDRMPDDFGRQQVTQQPPCDHQPQYTENVVWLPAGAISADKSGFPGNILHGSTTFDGNTICEHCRMTFQRNQLQVDQPNMANGFQPVANSCPEFPPSRDPHILNADAQLHLGIYSKDQGSPHVIFNGPHHESGWLVHHPLNSWVEEARAHISGPGRFNDHYVVDGAGMNFPFGHGNLTDDHHTSSNYVHHEDPRCTRVALELGNEVLNDQVVSPGTHIHVPILDEHLAQYGNRPHAYGADAVYQVPHGHAPTPSSWRNFQNPILGTPSIEASGSPHQADGSANLGTCRVLREGSPRCQIGVDKQNSWIDPPHKIVGFDGPALPAYSLGHAVKCQSPIFLQENQHPVAGQCPPDMLSPGTAKEWAHPLCRNSALIDEKRVTSVTSDLSVADSVKVEEKGVSGEEREKTHKEKVEGSNTHILASLEQNEKVDNEHELPSLRFDNFDSLRPAEMCNDVVEEAGSMDLSSHLETSENSASHLCFLPELIASVKKAALDGNQDVGECTEPVLDAAMKETGNDIESANAPGDTMMDSDSDNKDMSKIEPTKAEAEAIARGLQTIKNDDLEEVRELGSGTYGAVYHGKWKGSDVAIKRIKASCFAGRPSERDRLIADFWKEALMLSSLHHPNVVSFYGIVRDGPDGSLATVTEFMVNGSLKQFLQKKDRTIDRRKRLIIAMDAAFGMEYLHGKNIVHFDLKCENLLVNMRDPQRPVCKIGDLGLSKVKQQTLVSGGVRGTLPWMAPELLSGKSNMVTEKIDVYSFGIVMWELLTGEEPYADLHCASIIGGIVHNTLRPQIPTWCDPEWKSLMESCWAADSAERPSFSEISQKLRNMAAAMNVK